MKAYTFRLGTVLRIRGVESLLARQQVGVAGRALGAASGRERSAIETYEATARPPGELEGSGFVAARERGERLASVMLSATAARAAHERDLWAQRRAALGAERRVAVLERLDDRRRREWFVAVQHEDVAILDDFATVRAAARAMEVDGAD
jgi:hypothetical protein